MRRWEQQPQCGRMDPAPRADLQVGQLESGDPGRAPHLRLRDTKSFSVIYSHPQRLLRAGSRWWYRARARTGSVSTLCFWISTRCCDEQCLDPSIRPWRRLKAKKTSIISCRLAPWPHNELLFRQHVEPTVEELKRLSGDFECLFTSSAQVRAAECSTW